MKLSRKPAEERLLERERRYPIYTALDVTLQFALSVGVFAFALILLGIILTNTSPELHSHAAAFAHRIFS